MKTPGVRKSGWIPALVAGATAFGIYYLTAFRTITWWDSARYSLAAITLGIAPPPGSLLLTLIGWVFVRIPLSDSFAHRLDLLAVVLATGSIALLVYVSAHATRKDRIPTTAALTGAIIGGLIFAFGATMWDYARQFTPYILTTLFTVLILWVLFAWWDRADTKPALGLVFLIFLLLGLDFSVHRTNTLLIPGAVFWVGLRKGNVLASFKGWLAIVGGLALGLSFHLLLIPLAQRNPFLNFGDPSTLSRFWDYISLRQYGGGWLIHMFPRNAPFFKVQVADYLRSFGANFVSLPGLLALLPIGFGFIGIVKHFFTDWRKGLGIIALFLLGSLGAVVYFNVPEGYFRPMDRHYLPSFIIFAFWISYGVSAVLFLCTKLTRGFRELSFVAVGILGLLVPVYEVRGSFYQMNASQNSFAKDYARNILSTLPRNALLLTNGDNDTFPLWYLENAKGFRNDVTVINIPLLNIPWFVKQIVARDPAFPLRLNDKEIEALQPVAWRDTTIHIPVAKVPDLGLADGTPIPDSLPLKVSPTTGGSHLLVQDQLVLKMISANAWRRPVYVSTTVSESNIPWLRPCLRFEGLVWRVVPALSQSTNLDVLRLNLMRCYIYRGFSNRNIYLDEVSRKMAQNYLGAFLSLASAQREQGDRSGCIATLDFMERRLPLDRLQVPPSLSEMIGKLKQQ